MLLTIDNIETYYGHSHVLHGVSIEVQEGQVVALLGRNGVGKTTTLRSVMGITPPREGDIIFQGKSLLGIPSYRIARLGCGYVPQGRRLFKSLTVREHLEVFHREGSNAGWKPDKALDFFPRLKERINNKGSELSGGEQQMLAIARALMSNPRLLIMDEPTEGLAPLIVEEVGRLIKMIKDEGFAILLTEQKVQFALNLADDVYIMSKGHITYHGLPEELNANEEVKRQQLGV